MKDYLKNPCPCGRIHTVAVDEVVIGSGVAGLSFALRAAEYGKVTILCKSDPLVSSSAKAQGGIAAVIDKDDTFEEHVADTLDAGAGLCDEEAVRIIVEEAPAAIEELLDWGVDFDTEKDGEFDLGREGGHGKRRILHSKDTTGLEISTKLLRCVQQHPNITLLDHRIAIDLITTAKLGCVTEDRVLGAYVLDPATGEDVQGEYRAADRLVKPSRYQDGKPAGYSDLQITFEER